MQKLTGKIIYLTGATRGIGRAIALRLAREGVLLALCGRDAAAMKGVAAAVGEAGAAPPFTKTFDLAEEEALLSFYRESRDRLGPPDVLISNAGYNARKAPLSEVTTREFDAMIAVNLRAPFILMREAFADMKARGGGHMVVVLSTVCLFANELMGAYTAAKKGLQGLVDVLRKEGRPFNIAVSSIYPGGTDTAFRAAARPDYMRPESVAEAVVAVLTLPSDLIVHHMAFRPSVETNY